MLSWYEIHGRYAEERNFPVVLAVNQLETEKANWENTIDSIHQAFGSRAVVFQYPVNPGLGFDSFIDVLTMKMYKYTDDNGTREVLEIPADQVGKAEEIVHSYEMAAESDESLMEKFFEDGELSEEDMNKGLNIGFVKGELYPIFCLSAKKCIGVKRIMQFMLDVAPAPSEKVDGPTSLFVYKSSVEQHLGDVSYFKVMSGKIGEAQDLVNPVTGNKERVSALYAVAGKKKEKVSELLAGDLGCTVKLRNVKTNQTLNQPGYEEVVEPIVFPPSRYRTAIKAKDEKDEEKLGEALNRAAAEIPQW